MKLGAALVGFLSPLTIILWSSLVAFGMLTFAVLWRWPGIIVFLALNFGLAYRLNKSKKHSREGAFDDRLTWERMQAARDWLVNHERPVDHKQV